MLFFILQAYHYILMSIYNSNFQYLTAYCNIIILWKKIICFQYDINIVTGNHIGILIFKNNVINTNNLFNLLCTMIYKLFLLYVKISCTCD